MNAEVLLDAGESGCGELVMLIAARIKTLAPGAILEVHAYDLAAAVDIAAWCRMTQHPLLAQQLNSQPQRFWIQKRG
ncbi:MAG TPA: sulfurtransferase TusA family protein [Anaerolineae bacterium]|nr:sulfurtransferase TusA family protein [Anaerolineae bacterium]